MNRSQCELDEGHEALRECQARESLLLSDLRQLLDQPSTDQTRGALLRIMDRLLTHLPHHLELACQGGYLVEVRRLRPNWHRQIEALHGANLWCIAALNELRDPIARALPSATIEAKENGEIEIWIRSLAAIREHEIRLLQRAYTIDIGGEA